MNLMWLLRASRWVRNPPSLRRVLLVGGIVAACLALFAYEKLFGWPDWLTVPSNGRPRVPGI